MTDKQTVPVVAGPGQMEQVAQDLIRLADHPHDVVWQSRGGHFVVPEEVAVRYAAEQADTAPPESDPKPAKKAAAKKAAPAKEPKPRATRRRSSSSAKAAADTPAMKAEPAAPRSRSRSAKRKGGE